MADPYFTSDHHFDHYNIIEFCNRPFQAAEDMDKEMIARWNEKVSPGDTVWHLGDFSFGPKGYSIHILNQLHGVIHLIRGNHDLKRVKGEFRDRFESVRDYHELRLGGDTFVLCHYPMLSWNKSFHGSYMLHGHCHGTTDHHTTVRRIDVGVDTNDFYPYSLDEIKGILADREFPGER